MANVLRLPLAPSLRTEERVLACPVRALRPPRPTRAALHVGFFAVIKAIAESQQDFKAWENPAIRR